MLRIKEKQTHIEGKLPEQWLRQQEKKQIICHWSPVVTFSKNISEQNIYLFIYEEPTNDKDVQALGKKKSQQFIFLAQCAGHAFHKICFFKT